MVVDRLPVGAPEEAQAVARQGDIDSRDSALTRLATLCSSHSKQGRSKHRSTCQSTAAPHSLAAKAGVDLVRQRVHFLLTLFSGIDK